MTRTGKFVWWELYTDDVENAIEFYAALFGWEIIQQDMGSDFKYNMICNGNSVDHGIAGILSNQIADGAPPHWLSYLNVDDVDTASATAKANGAKVLKEATDIPTVGRFAVLADPQGAVFAPFKSANPATKPDDEKTYGDFAWTELHAADADAAVAFYRKICRWQDKPMDMGTGIYHVQHRADVDVSQDRGEAGIMTRMSTDKHPNWLPYVSVENVDMLSAKLTEHRGEVMMPPTDIPNVGRFTVFKDPTGAALAAITFGMN